jgi:predicted DNA-binding transcriptional regulator AlpA
MYTEIYNTSMIIENSESYIDDCRLCSILGIKKNTLNNKICNGESLPAFIKIRGIRRRFWLIKDVEEWLEKNNEMTKWGI